MSTALISDSAASLLQFWKETRLRVEDAVSTSRKPGWGTAVSWREALQDILRVGYGLRRESRYLEGAWRRIDRRTTPSAGGLYPFEVLAAVVGEGTFFYSPETGELYAWPGEPLSVAEIVAMGFRTSRDDRIKALLILLARPWVSTRKYRSRGYTYCHLDVAHAAVNLALHAAALGAKPQVHLRFFHDDLARRLRLDGLCREPLVALAWTADRAGDQAAPASGSSSAPTSDLPLEPPSEAEREHWHVLQPILALHAEHRLPTPPVAVRSLAELPDDGTEILALPAPRRERVRAKSCQARIVGRSSAKGFHDLPIDLQELSEMLAALRAEGFPCDGSRERLGARLVLRRVAGITPGVYTYSATLHSLRHVDALGPDEPFVEACMRQQMAGDAAGVLLLHAPLQRRVEEVGYSAFAELHFRAGELAHRLYLAAAGLENVGMTCIGGFDDARCARLGRLETGEETLYVVLFGVPDENAVKHDRLGIAYSHGHTA